MKRPSLLEDTVVGNGGVWGGGLAVLLAANTVSIGFLLSEGNGRLPDNPGRAAGQWLASLLFLLVCSGSLAMLLAGCLTLVLKRIAPRFQRRRRFFRAAVLLGLPLGLLNMGVTVFLILGSTWELRTWQAENPYTLTILIATGLAAGVGTGLGAALAVPFHRPDPEADG